MRNCLSNLNQIRVPSTFNIECSGEAHGILCWFNVSHEDISEELNHGNFQFSAFLLKNSLNVKCGSNLDIFTSNFHSSFVFELE